MADGTPARPAAVSGPGALSARTDGGAGSTKQPLRVASGGAYGERQAAEAQQAGAPMAAGGPAAGGAPPAGATAPPPDGAPGVGVFGPSAMPSQPITTGVVGPMGGPPPDPEIVLRELVRQFPTPHMIGLLNRYG